MCCCFSYIGIQALVQLPKKSCHVSHVATHGNALFDVLPYAAAITKDRLADYFGNVPNEFKITCPFCYIRKIAK